MHHIECSNNRVRIPEPDSKEMRLLHVGRMISMSCCKAVSAAGFSMEHGGRRAQGRQALYVRDPLGKLVNILVHKN
ncbi:hypothetical protein GR197_05525 [Rhizobium phaseoli]|uniref:Uncharacterized protein n=1 Tax=Rhizobium phaseoli TaxID=396 RepID=A0A7K3UA29_9HYPH|nr:hypothetical protein [Rhizobium phaseoli]NEJ69999.1 hypothetical protein [Rhizobium phaseoli]